MVHLAALTLLSLSLSAAPTCPDGGETLFLKADRGFQGYRLIGGDSYRSFFSGGELERASAGRPAPGARAEFWVDQVLAQWMLVGREAFTKGEPRSDRELLVAFHGSLSGAAAGPAKPFAPQEAKAADGRPRLYGIWSSALGTEATQFWVATPHPRGVVVLTVVAPTPDAVAKARSVIDAYVANFGPIDPASCERFREAAGKAR